MKDEIKEILDRLKDDSQMCSNSYYRIFKDERDILKDYITNLQEENRILKENAEHNDKVVDKARWNEMIYKSRNEEAINEVIRVLQIILEQPSEDKLDDLWIINKLEGIQTLLQGENKDDTNSR